MTDRPRPTAEPPDTRDYWVVGDILRLRLTGAETGGAFSIVEIDVSPGGGPPLHTHEREAEAFYVLEGVLEWTTEGRTIEAPAGTTFTGPRGVAHTYANRSDEPAKLLFMPYPAGFELYFTEVGIPVTDPTAPAPPADLEKMLSISPKYGLTYHVER